MAVDTDHDAAASFAHWMTGRRVLVGMLRRTHVERVHAARIHADALRIDPLLTNAALHDLFRRRVLLGLLRRSRAAGIDRVSQIILRALHQTREQAFVARQAALRQAGFGKDEDGTYTIAEAAHHAIALSADLRAAGWRPGGTTSFPSQHIHRLPGLSGLPENAERAWIDAVLAGAWLPDSSDALVGQAERILASGLFDGHAYRALTAISGDDRAAAMHYLMVGDALGIPPSSQFDPAYYAARYPDIAERHMVRLLHYIDAGQQEGRYALPPMVLRDNPACDDPTRENIILVVHQTSRTGAPVLKSSLVRSVQITLGVVVSSKKYILLVRSLTVRYSVL